MRGWTWSGRTWLHAEYRSDSGLAPADGASRPEATCRLRSASHAWRRSSGRRCGRRRSPRAPSPSPDTGPAWSSGSRSLPSWWLPQLAPELAPGAHPPVGVVVRGVGYGGATNGRCLYLYQRHRVGSCHAFGWRRSRGRLPRAGFPRYVLSGSLEEVDVRSTGACGRRPGAEPDGEDLAICHAARRWRCAHGTTTAASALWRPHGGLVATSRSPARGSELPRPRIASKDRTGACRERSVGGSAEEAVEEELLVFEVDDLQVGEAGGRCVLPHRARSHHGACPGRGGGGQPIR